MMGRSPALVLLAALALTAVTARLGLWQVDRAAQKRSLEAALAERRAMPALDTDSLARDAREADGQAHRSVVLDGRWSPAQTVFLDNRPMNARAGFIVVTPLVLADGSAVLVQRGWQARDAADPARVSMPPTPADAVRLRGRMAPPPARLYELETAGTGLIRQNLDIDAFAAETRLKLRPFSVLQTEPAAGPPDGLLRAWPEIHADVHKHYGYAFQWFALSALTVCLYVWFQIIRPRRRRRSD
jgi:surfeit locus 1 family protein